jgi:K+-sensing histidine kinase KdpD
MWATSAAAVALARDMEHLLSERHDERTSVQGDRLRRRLIAGDFDVGHGHRTPRTTGIGSIRPSRTATGG